MGSSSRSRRGSSRRRRIEAAAVLRARLEESPFDPRLELLQRAELRCQGGHLGALVARAGAREDARALEARDRLLAELVARLALDRSLTNASACALEPRGER